MKKSEKILLGVLAVVALWAGYIVLFDPAPAPGTRGAAADADYAAVVQTMQQELQKTALGEQERHAVSLAMGDASRPLFYASDKQFYFTGGQEFAADADGALVYSGYLQAGNTAYAIINGIEYTAGDALALEGCRVKSISPGYVTVVRLDPNTGRSFERRIPLVEDDVDDVTLKAVY
jgi:hypothetical protein